MGCHDTGIYTRKDRLTDWTLRLWRLSNYGPGPFRLPVPRVCFRWKAREACSSPIRGIAGLFGYGFPAVPCSLFGATVCARVTAVNAQAPVIKSMASQI